MFASSEACEGQLSALVIPPALGNPIKPDRARIWSDSWLPMPIALFIATIGAVSVFKAMYNDKRELKCTWVGGGTNVPLGFLSLTENLMMIC